MTIPLRVVGKLLQIRFLDEFRTLVPCQEHRARLAVIGHRVQALSSGLLSP